VKAHLREFLASLRSRQTNMHRISTEKHTKYIMLLLLNSNRKWLGLHYFVEEIS